MENRAPSGERSKAEVGTGSSADATAGSSNGEGDIRIGHSDGVRILVSTDTSELLRIAAVDKSARDAEVANCQYRFRLRS